MFCKSCGKEIPDNSIFCLYCGVPLAAIDAKEVARRGVSLVTVKAEKVWGWGKAKIKVIVDGELAREVTNGGSVSFETQNGKHIVYCEAKWINRSDSIEFHADSNEILFSVAFDSWSINHKILLNKTKETERGTWE